MALNVKQKYPGTQGGAAQLYASDTRLSLRRREQVFTRLSKSYKENMDISSTRSSSDEEIIVLLNEERRRKRHLRQQCRCYLAYIFFVVTYMCSCNGCMPVRAVCKPHSPDLKRGALATDARGCSLWRSLLERPPPAPESRVRDPL